MSRKKSGCLASNLPGAVNVKNNDAPLPPVLPLKQPPHPAYNLNWGNSMVQNIDSILNEIKARLVPDGVEKLVLFGSYANGTPDEDSDIDLLVVTSDRIMPRNYAEKSNIYLRIAKKMEELRRQVPIDLIVHTHSMHQKFIEMDSMFCREILHSGRVFYEKNHASLA